MPQAFVLLDHHSAHIQALGGAAESLTEHRHATRQHASNVRTEHAFFSQVCDKLMGHNEILVLGGHTAQADFRRYVEKHRPALTKHLVGWQTVDHPSAGQALAAAHVFFEKFDRMAGHRHAE